jgi:hypothetical protein
MAPRLPGGMPLEPSLFFETRCREPGRYGPLSRISATVLHAFGWTLSVAETLPEKCVVVMYPHTSNWDFPVGLLAKWAVGLTVKGEALSFAGKASLFKWPWGGFFRAVGGFPVDRSGSTGFAKQMTERFAAAQRLRFVIAPEGTRSYVPYMRSSFYYVALAAKVPVALGSFDFLRRRVTVNAFFMPCGDLDSDLSAIHAFYYDLGNQGAKPANAAPWTFKRS